MDAALALETGQLPTPSPPRSTTDEDSGEDLEDSKVGDVVDRTTETTENVLPETENVEDINNVDLRDGSGGNKRLL